LNAPLASGWISVNGVGLNGCHLTSDSVYINVPSTFISINGMVGNSCIGDSIFVIAEHNLDSILWSTPMGNFQSDTIDFILSNLSGGSYSVQGWDQYGCTYSQSSVILANSLPNPSSISDTILCLNDYFGNNYSNDEYTYSWNNPIFEDSTLVTENQWYNFTVTGVNGCSITDSIFLVTVNCSDELPNVFTPNGDGVNDYFYIDEAVIYPNNRLLITNRWGNLVFKEDGYRNTFDGNALVDGVYFYVFYHDFAVNPEKAIKGFLTIVR